MRIIYTLSRYFVGSLFIFSGVIKINDPVGTQIKLEEYFQVFSSDFTSMFELFVPFSLYISVFLCCLEIVIGFALLLNFRMKITSSITLGLIIFFTFLTFYSAYFNKVTDCGCFGDAIKLTPWESFSKDIVLLIFSLLIYFLYSKVKDQKGLLPIKVLYDINFKSGFLIFITLVCLIISYSAINFLPFIDFRAYKVGNYIPNLMKPSEELKYSYLMEKDGRTYEFGTYPNDESYIFKEIKLLNPDAQPKITDYSIWNEDNDLTKESFLGNKLFIIIHDIDKIEISNKNEKEFITKLKALISNISFWVEPIFLTSSNPISFNNFIKRNQLDINLAYGDATVLKTMIRSNPGFFLMRNGTVKGKWHHNNFPDAQEILQKVNVAR